MKARAKDNYSRRLNSDTSGIGTMIVLLVIAVIVIAGLGVYMIIQAQNEQNEIVGTWEVPNQDVQIIFNDDGTGVVEDTDTTDNFEQNFEWEILDDNVLQIQWDNGTSDDFPYSVSEDGDTLTIDGDELGRVDSDDDGDDGDDDSSDDTTDDDTDDTTDDGDDDIDDTPPVTNGTRTIKIELYTTRAPITTKNFIDLANQGKYRNVPFHRVIESFMIQGGDFTNKDGTGGHAAEYHDGLGTSTIETSWMIPDEFHPELSNVRGTISMANRGPDTGGSQFFINTVDNIYLDYTTEPSKHPVFGMVVDGMDIVDEISKVPTSNDRPIDPVTILSVTIETSDGNTFALMQVEF